MAGGARAVTAAVTRAGGAKAVTAAVTRASMRPNRSKPNRNDCQTRYDPPMRNA